MRHGVYRELVLVLWGAKRLGRPVKWTAGRREGFLTDEHGTTGRPVQPAKRVPSRSSYERLGSSLGRRYRSGWTKVPYRAQSPAVRCP